ncbi:MAG: hypothetical protein CL925_00820 [Deltaproteobacteria bacterium]|nr:hypothetical protein [Deltaproteobacteria bacterium]
MSYTEQIAQVFVMINLQDIEKSNGCLRGLPGSHCKIHGLHDYEKAHPESVSRVTKPEDHLYQSVDGETEISVNFGDMVVCDAEADPWFLCKSFSLRKNSDHFLVSP